MPDGRKVRVANDSIHHGARSLVRQLVVYSTGMELSATLEFSHV